MTLQQIADRIAEWVWTTREIERVRFLDDRLLRDMGIDRREITRRVRGR